MMDFSQNHADIAWSNNLGQFKKASIMEAFFRSIHKPSHGLQASAKALFEERWLDNAVGSQLDGIGQILRQSRYVDFPISVNYFGFNGQSNVGGFGSYRMWKESGKQYQENITELPDEEYRRILYWRVAVLTSSGTAPDIHRALRQILDIHNFKSASIGNANFKIFIALNSNTNMSLLSQIERWLPIAAGVGFRLSTSVGRNTFGFKSQGFTGLGVGSFSRSNI